MPLSMSYQDAARFLIRYQLAPSSVQGVFDRLGAVQYDPLNPVGRNPDLVFQARVPGYRVDDWQMAAYRDRIAYDAWDKQACLVPMADWPMRALIRGRYHPWHDREILDEHPDAVLSTFAELDARGPLSSLEFDDRRRAAERHSWYGPTIIKRVLRALWARGELATHHRRSGRHYYDRPERVIPPIHFHHPPLVDNDGYHRWIILRRHQTAGLLRPTASAEIWSVCGDATARARAVTQLVEIGELLPVLIGEQRRLYHMPASALPCLNGPPPERRVTFVGPLDSLLWDRKALKTIFGFDYIWEVYKREQDRRWGYYVLPVLYGDRFIGRIDSRLEGATWTVSRWWWEADVERDADLIDAVRTAASRFVEYLNAQRVEIPTHVDAIVRDALLEGLRLR